MTSDSYIPDDFASREVVEWDWVVMGDGRKLHAPKVWDDPRYNAYTEDGETWCGRRGWLSIPGVFTRMGARRCGMCCQATGMPPGKGSPKNDDACRPIAEARIEALRAARAAS